LCKPYTKDSLFILIMGQIPEIHNGLSPTIKHNIISSNNEKHLYKNKRRISNYVVKVNIDKVKLRTDLKQWFWQQNILQPLN